MANSYTGFLLLALLRNFIFHAMVGNMSAQVIVERATFEQASEVHGQIPEFDSSYIADNVDRPDLAIRSKNPYAIIARIGEVAVGYMIGYDRKDVANTMHIWLNGTHPRYRGQGVFRALLNNLTDEARTRGHNTLTVMSDSEQFPDMISVLEAHHFEITAQDGNSVRFKKHIEPAGVSDINA